MNKPDQNIEAYLKGLRLRLAGTENSGVIGGISAAATKLAQRTDDGALLLAIADLIDNCFSKLERIHAHPQPTRSRVSTPTNTMPMIKMRIGAWRTDENGIKTREVTSEA